MVKIKAEILIERPVEDVFTFLAVDFLENLPKIEHTILMIKQITEGEVRKGTQFHLITAKSEGEKDASKVNL